jgi:hypothetical protein
MHSIGEQENARPTQRPNLALAAPVSHSLKPMKYQISAKTLAARPDWLTELQFEFRTPALVRTFFNSGEA